MLQGGEEKLNVGPRLRNLNPIAMVKNDHECLERQSGHTSRDQLLDFSVRPLFC